MTTGRRSEGSRTRGIRFAFAALFVGAFFERPRANAVRPYGQTEHSLAAQPKFIPSNSRFAVDVGEDVCYNKTNLQHKYEIL